MKVEMKQQTRPSSGTRGDDDEGLDHHKGIKDKMMQENGCPQGCETEPATNKPGYDGMPYLDLWETACIAASTGDLDVLGSILEEGINLNQIRTNGKTLLHVAASVGHMQVVRLLLQHGANPRILNNWGGTPSMLALLRGHYSVARLLQKKELMVDQMSDSEATADDSSEGEDVTPDDEASAVVMFLQVCKAGILQAVKEAVSCRGAEAMLSSERSAQIKCGLHMAAGEGKASVMIYLLSQGWPVNFYDEKGMTPLSYAAKGGFLCMCELLMGRGAKINSKDQNGNEPLHAAVLAGHLEIVRSLLKSGATLEARNTLGLVPLHLGTLRGHVEVVRLLLSEGANSTARSLDGKTYIDLARAIGVGYTFEPLGEAERHAFIYACLQGNLAEVKEWVWMRAADVVRTVDPDNGSSAIHFAASTGRYEVTQFLLDHGAAINQTDHDGRTPLHFAAMSGNETMVRFLLQKGADLRIRAANGDTAQYVALRCGHELIAILLELKERETEQLTPNELQPDSPNEGVTDRNHVFFEACKGNKLTVVKEWVLVQAVDALRLRDEDGRRGIHWASLGGAFNVVPFLLDLGEDVNLTDRAQWTPLHFAAASGEDTVVSLLLVRGADPRKQDIRGHTARDVAELRGYTSITLELEQKEKAMPPAHEAHDEDEEDEYNTHPFLQCCCDGRLEDVKDWVVRKKMDVNLKRDKNGWGSMHLAAWDGHLEVVRFLLDHGADIDLVGTYDTTSLYLASLFGHELVVKLLLYRGANLKPNHSLGDSPRHAAEMEGHWTIVRLLQQKEKELANRPRKLNKPIKREVTTKLMPSLNDIKSESSLKDLNCLQLRFLLRNQGVRFSKACKKLDLQEKAAVLLRAKQAGTLPPSVPSIPPKTKSPGPPPASSPEGSCRVCKKSQMDCILLDCGHLVACFTCGQALSVCPCCAKPVVKAVKILKA